MILDLPHGPVRLAANLGWMFTELPFLDRFGAAAHAGFTAVEYAQPYRHHPALLRKQLDQAGLRQVLINTPAGPRESPTALGAAFIPDARAEFRDGVKAGLEYAQELGASVLHVMAGLRPVGCEPDRAFACYVANIVWAAEQARGSDVSIVLEAINKRDQPRYGLSSPEAGAHVAQAAGTDVVGVLFDVYHAQVDRGDLLTRFDSLRNDIKHVQIADNPGRGEPGTGEVAYGTVLGHIARSGYEGWIGCEYRPVGDTAAGLSWIEELAKEQP
ncbi:hydroxypyruvate isomerase family protein [Nonomuraea angiospora]|uniref:hydroxypyruvate isomerase family protein n=1 Tax=Nonomuraea angiospora TaxID=46172 RepID=UPI0029AEA19C|nr:TIM barrel protein [Nonomuraea angiospora]MDX3100913.1 TIM barrel protein [Nonomuraea angiospora]